MTILSEDKREIKYISCDVAQFDIATVGRDGVTKIVAYDEGGQCGCVPWLAVYKGDFLWMRLSAANVRVTYKEVEG